MRLVFLVLLGGVVAAYGWRWLAGKRHPVMLGIFALAFAVTGVFEVAWKMREHAYTQVARDLTGRSDVDVHCQRTLAYLVDISGFMGYVPYPPDGPPVDAYLRKDTCEALASYRDDPADPNPAEVRAVHVLTHEAMHLLNERDEALAECKAMQRNALTARALGADPEDATRLARLYYVSWYPRVPPQYRHAECRPGGDFDEGLPDPPWGEPGAAPSPDLLMPLP